MKKIVSLVMILIFVLSGCTSNTLFQSKYVKIDNTVINLPIEVKEYIEKDDIASNITEVEAYSTIAIELEKYSVIISNPDGDNINIDDALIIGFMQNYDDIIDNDVITFPENLSVGMYVNPEEVIKKLVSSGGIKGDVGYTTNSDLSEYDIICGQRIINLSHSFKEESEKVIYPVEISIRNNIITRIQMIFMR